MISNHLNHIGNQFSQLSIILSLFSSVPVKIILIRIRIVVMCLLMSLVGIECVTDFCKASKFYLFKATFLQIFCTCPSV